jgi:cyclophilin family peptidyl-prolyl cis-trans isomerase
LTARDGRGTARLAILLALVCGPLAVLGSEPGQPPAQRTPVEMAQLAARLAIMRAEDDRLPIPDDLQTSEIDTLRARLAADVQTVIEYSRSRDGVIRSTALRALGRYERRELTGEILPHLFLPPAAGMPPLNPLAQSMRGPALPDDGGGQQLRDVLEAVHKIGNDHQDLTIGVAQALGRLPFDTPDQAAAADAFFTLAFKRLDPDPGLRLAMGLVALAAESRVRVYRRLTPLDDDTVDWLRRIVRGARHTYPDQARSSAMAALVSAVGVDEETLRAAADATGVTELRRLAVLSLAGAGSPITGDDRSGLLRTLLTDRSSQVRYEAVRAWAGRGAADNGCQPLLDSLKDDSRMVVLAALDVLAGACREDVNVTDALTTFARTPPPSGDWQREAHALVALARRAPDRAALALPGHVAHPIWQVRMYAARAAAILNDLVALDRLTADRVDGVREATLPGLRKLKGANSDPQFIAALESRDYQLLRTAANELKGANPTRALAAALADALKRVTADGKETSRELRLTLLERLRELGCPDQAAVLIPLLQDIDIPVALAAHGLLELWTEKTYDVAPHPAPRPPLPTPAELDDPSIVTVRMDSGRSFDVALHWSVAPLTVTRFLRLVRANYYDGLTFHRIVPNFIAQGGSPAGTDESGDGQFMRDEVGGSNRRGTLGIIARGRDLGNAQFYVNLVDNPRLDYDYTVFAAVCDQGMQVVDQILEGDRIETMRIARPTRTCRSR